MPKTLKMTAIMGVSALCFSFGVNESLAQSRYAPTAATHKSAPVPAVNHHNSRANSGVEYGGLMGLLKGKNSKPRNMRALRAAPVHPRARQFGGYNMGRYGPQAAQTPGRYYKAKPSQTIRPVTPPIFQQWVEFEPDYLIQPDDQLDIVVSSAPELSRTLTVGPDGRIVMPMSQPIMAAGRSFVQVQALLKAELSKQLRDPTVAVTPRAYAPQQIFVGGEVGQPGTYTIPGRIGALEAIFMAGGMRPTARTTQVAVLRRAPNGGMMMRSVDIRGGLKDIRGYSDNMQLKRGDIIYVPQSTLAEVGTFMQNFRNALPVDFNLSYQFGAQNGGTTVVSP